MAKASKAKKPSAAASRALFDAIRSHHFTAVDAMISAETSPVALVLTSLSGEILYANPAFQTMFRAPDLAARRGLNLQELAASHLDPGVLARLARDGIPQRIVLKGTATGAESRWWCHARRELGEAGLPKWLILTFTEVDTAMLGHSTLLPVELARDQAEHQERFGTWTMPAGADGSPLLGEMYWSRGLSLLFARAHGAQPHPVRDWLDLIHRDDRPQLLEALRTLIAEGRGYSIEYRLADESGRTLHSRAQLLQSPAAPGITLTGIERDVTDSVAVPRAEQEQFHLQRALAECIELPAVALDHQLKVRWFNALFAGIVRDLWDVHPETGWALGDVIRQPSQRRRIARSARHALLGRRSAVDWQTQIPGADGRRFDLIFNPIRDGAGRVAGVVAVVMDPPSERRRSTGDHGRTLSAAGT
jgi:PAS domain-containing protein